MAKVARATSIPNFRIPKSIYKIDKFQNLLLIKPLFWEDGYIIVLVSLGLGVEIDKDLTRVHPDKRHQPHLELGQYPYNPRANHGFTKG